MREIKFRAWNKEKNIMCYENEDNSAGYLDGWIASDIQVINQTLNSDFTKETYDFMEFTGLKDKNGKEIYEGDIVAEKGHYVNSDRLVYQKIQWKENYSCWLRGEYQRLTPKNIKTYQIEVIGNIYDNPELLETQN